MKRRISHRRRIYSPESNTVPQAIFTRKYVNYLVPALFKIKYSKEISNENVDSEVEELVRYEVDMALVMSSTDRFAWNHALKEELLQRNVSLGRLHYSSVLDLKPLKCPTTMIEIEAGDWKSCHPPHQPICSLKFSPNPKRKLGDKKLKNPNIKTLTSPRMKKEEEMESKDGSLLRNLRSLIPGADDEMDIDELLGEVGSYIVCLELQVNILKYLVDVMN